MNEFPAAERCVLGARGRGDALLATAPPARRFLLLEVPGPWLPDATLPPELTRAEQLVLRAAAIGAGARILLIRRPGRHPVEPDRPRRWGIAVPARPGSPQSPVRWGYWHTGADLLEIDLAAPPDAGEQRPVALVCTHGRHDLCCAIEGRAVVTAAARDPRVDVWECSHLGGDRFAANLLWLPSGLLFGGLTAPDTGRLLDAALAGKVLLEHYRGRCGDPQAAQAAQWHFMHAVREDRPDRVVVERATVERAEPELTSESPRLERSEPERTRSEPARPQGPERTGTQLGDVHHSEVLTAVLRHQGERYRLLLATGWSEPHRLTCRATRTARSRTYSPIGSPERI